MPSGGFEPAVPVSEMPQAHGLDRAAPGLGPTCALYRNLSALPEENHRQPVLGFTPEFRSGYSYMYEF
jgi:hypothetical protein